MDFNPVERSCGSSNTVGLILYLTSFFFLLLPVLLLHKAGGSPAPTLYLHLFAVPGLRRIRGFLGAGAEWAQGLGSVHKHKDQDWFFGSDHPAVWMSSLYLEKLYRI